MVALLNFVTLLLFIQFYLVEVLFNFIVSKFCLNSLGDALRIWLCGGFI